MPGSEQGPADVLRNHSSRLQRAHCQKAHFTHFLFLCLFLLALNYLTYYIYFTYLSFLLTFCLTRLPIVKERDFNLFS